MQDLGLVFYVCYSSAKAFSFAQRLPPTLEVPVGAIHRASGMYEVLVCVVLVAVVVWCCCSCCRVRAATTISNRQLGEDAVDPCLWVGTSEKYNFRPPKPVRPDLRVLGPVSVYPSVEIAPRFLSTDFFVYDFLKIRAE